MKTYLLSWKPLLLLSLMLLIPLHGTPAYSENETSVTVTDAIMFEDSKGNIKYFISYEYNFAGLDWVYVGGLGYRPSSGEYSYFVDKPELEFKDGENGKSLWKWTIDDVEEKQIRGPGGPAGTAPHDSGIPDESAGGASVSGGNTPEARPTPVMPGLSESAELPASLPPPVITPEVPVSLSTPESPEPAIRPIGPVIPPVIALGEPVPHSTPESLRPPDITTQWKESTRYAMKETSVSGDLTNKTSRMQFNLKEVEMPKSKDFEHYCTIPLPYSTSFSNDFLKYLNSCHVGGQCIRYEKPTRDADADKWIYTTSYITNFIMLENGIRGTVAIRFTQEDNLAEGHTYLIVEYSVKEKRPKGSWRNVKSSQIVEYANNAMEDLEGKIELAFGG
jgi:hypothetical protein